MTNDMGLLSGILYFLAGSAASASSGKKTPIEQIRKERVELSNGSWNYTLRKELQMIDTFDCRNQLSSVQYYIKKAQEDARFNYGTFVIAPDVKKRYQDLLSENARQIQFRADKAKKKEQKKQLAEERQQKNLEADSTLVKRYVDLLTENGFSEIKTVNSIRQAVLNAQYKKQKFKIQYNYGMLNNEKIQEQCFSAAIFAFLQVFSVEKSKWVETISDFFEEHNIQATVHPTYLSEPFLPIHIQFMSGGMPTVDLALEGEQAKEETVDYIQKYSHSDVGESKKTISDNIHSVDFDSMDGWQFERFCAEVLEKNGYIDVTVTSGSGDQGVDIIAFRDGIKYGIQCKCYSNDIGNKAVQEIYSGKTFYNCHVGIVLTNRFFTSAAIELARTSGIILWDRNKLLELIKQSGIEE